MKKIFPIIIVLISLSLIGTIYIQYNWLRTMLINKHDELQFKVIKTLDELMNNAEDLKIPVFYGGPVQMDTIHFLHQYPDKIPGSYEVLNGIYWGGEFERAIHLIKEGEIDTNKIRFYIGYSGWGTGQLADELKEKSWLTTEATRKLVFHKKAEEIWKDALRHLGGDYEMMTNFPIDPQLN